LGASPQHHLTLEEYSSDGTRLNGPVFDLADDSRAISQGAFEEGEGEEGGEVVSEPYKKTVD